MQLVISDAAPLACTSAARAGIPSIVVSNFTWDWIYSGYADAFATHAPRIIPLMSEAYALAAAGWRLPMHGGFETIPTVLDLPLVARHARPAHTRGKVFGCLRIPGERPVVLSSFGGYGIHGLDHSTLDCLDAWTVVITGREPQSGFPPGLVYVDEAEIYNAGLRY
ncbi:hypothetical protein BH18ACI5_BH18ACI5_20630 [soil metagenome]